jgi:hypothetical protein
MLFSWTKPFFLILTSATFRNIQITFSSPHFHIMTDTDKSVTHRFIFHKHHTSTTAQKGSVLRLKKNNDEHLHLISIVQPCMHACIFQNKCGIYHRQKPIFAVCLSISLPYFAQKMNGAFWITHTASAAWVNARHSGGGEYRIICSKSTQTTELFIAALFAQLIRPCGKFYCFIWWIRRAHAHLDDKSRAVKNACKRDGGGTGNETSQSLSFNSSIYTAVYFSFEVQKFVVQINREFLFSCKIHRTHSNKRFFTNNEENMIHICVYWMKFLGRRSGHSLINKYTISTGFMRAKSVFWNSSLLI